MPLAALFSILPNFPSAAFALCSLEALRRIVGGETMTTAGAQRTRARHALSQFPPCSAHRLLSWVGAPRLQGSGPSLCPVPMP
jgi:hypothetical protein